MCGMWRIGVACHVDILTGTAHLADDSTRTVDAYFKMSTTRWKQRLGSGVGGGPLIARQCPCRLPENFRTLGNNRLCLDDPERMKSN